MGELPAFTPAESQLEIVKSDTASEQDVTPLFSPITLALEELQLRQIMNTIQRDGYRYVGITATDPLDTAFLAELVRGHCPNAQLLVVSGSTSFVHPKRRGFLKGALLATGYPLHHETQHWIFPWGANADDDKSNQWMLASDMDGTTGIYNAAVMHLADRQDERWRGNQFSLLESDSSPLQLVDYGSPFVTSADRPYQPAVWISAVGQEDLIPLKVSQAENATDSHLVRITFRKLPSPPKFDRTPSVNFSLSGALLIVVSMLTLLIVAEIHAAAPLSDANDQNSSDGDRCDDQRLTGWWPTFIDTVSPLFRPREDQANELLLTARGRQLVAMLIPSSMMFGLCAWTAWLCVMIGLA